MFDYFGKNADRLKTKKLWLFDMDGTIYNENTLFEGTLELLEYIKSIGGKYVFITNNSSKSVSEYVAKVNNMGIAATEDNFFTSTGATALLLNERHPDALVYCMGTRAMIEELTKNGVRITEQPDAAAEVILIGFDTEITGEKLRNTSFMLGRDLPYYATNPDIVCPVSFGYIPDCGSYSQILKNATGKYPQFIGKPEPTMINVAMQKMGVSKKETVVLGDRIYTDIASGVNAGVDTICVLTGEVTLADIEKSDIEPAFVFEGVHTVINEIKNN